MARTPSAASPYEVYQYYQGECHVFALAMNRYLGWPIHLVLDASQPHYQNKNDWDDVIPVVCHAYALDPDGNAWDIRGVRPTCDIVDELTELMHLGEPVMQTLDGEDELWPYVSTHAHDLDRPLPHYTDNDVEMAWAKARQALHLIPSFRDALKNTTAALELQRVLGEGVTIKPAQDRARSAAQFQDQYSDGEPGHANAQTLEWFAVDAYPIERLLDAVDAGWFKEERQMWAEEGDPERFDDMLSEPIHEPVIVFDQGEQGGWTWDGNHRIGATLVKGHATIPAIVGVRPRPSSLVQACHHTAKPKRPGLNA